MSLCASCRVALRQAIRQHRRPISSSSSSSPANKATSQSIRAILSTPSWSISTLFEDAPPTSTSTSTSKSTSTSTSTSTSPPEITPSQLHHLLRLSALPPPRSPEEEASMIATIQSQLRFVQAVQQVDTRGVEPLRAIRDETRAAVSETTVGLSDVQDVLEGETLVGHYKRPKRVRERVASAAEEWDALSTAAKRAGRYFVVEGGRKTTEG